MSKTQNFSEVVRRMRKNSFDSNHADQQYEQTLLFIELQKNPETLLKQYSSNPYFKIKMDLLCQKISTSNIKSIHNDIDLIAFQNEQIPHQEFITKNLMIKRNKNEYQALLSFKLLISERKDFKDIKIQQF